MSDATVLTSDEFEGRLRFLANQLSMNQLNRSHATLDALRYSHSKLRSQRDALAEALKLCAEVLEDTGKADGESVEWIYASACRTAAKQAKQALASLEG